MRTSKQAWCQPGIASECYGFDPYYNSGFEKQGFTFEEGLSLVGKIARKGGLKGLKQAAKVAMGGQRILRDVPYSLHMTLDAHTDGVAAEHVDLCAEICAAAGGTEMTDATGDARFGLGCQIWPTPTEVTVYYDDDPSASLATASITGGMAVCKSAASSRRLRSSRRLFW